MRDLAFCSLGIGHYGNGSILLALILFANGAPCDLAVIFSSSFVLPLLSRMALTTTPLPQRLVFDTVSLWAFQILR
jgi:hypothetical protein